MSFNSHSEGLEYASIVHDSMFSPIKYDANLRKNVKLTPQEIYIIMKFGEEFGFGPNESLNRISSAKGKLSVNVDGLLSLCFGSGKIEKIKTWYDHENSTAYCEIKRKDLTESVTAKFSLEDAIKANLYGKKTPDGRLIPGPWVDYTERMLTVRATGGCIKLCCNDLTRGAPSTEEVLDYKDYSLSSIKECAKVNFETTVSSDTLDHLNFLIEHIKAEEELRNKWLSFFGVKSFEFLSEENAIKLISKIEKENKDAYESWVNHLNKGKNDE